MAAQDLKTFKDIQDAILEELKIPDTDTITLSRIKRDINICYRDIASRKRWDWLKKFITLTHRKYISSGTASVTSDSSTVTLTSAPSIGVKDYWITFNGHEEVYRVASHTAASTSIILQSPFTGTTASAITYKLWTDKVPLPTDCVETIEVAHQNLKRPMVNIGPQRMRRLVARHPTAEGWPTSYSTNDYKDPNPYSTSLTSTSSRASAGLVKTVVFDSDVSSSLEDGDRIQISGASDSTYNGEWIVSTVSTTTITFTGLVSLQETTTADTGMTVAKLGTKTAAEAYRELWLYPSIYRDQDITLHVDYIQSIVPLENDSDEPLIPLEDRIILKYCALQQQWVKHRNQELYQNNERWYKEKFVAMSSKVGDSSDNPNIYTDRQWADRKRYNRYKY